MCRWGIPGYYLIIIRFPRVERFFPPADAKTPFTAWFEAEGGEVVASGGGEGEEGGG